MALQRALVLFPINSITVDTGAGIDVRALSDSEGGATDSTQSVRNTVQASSSERRFDPATANDATVLNVTTTHDDKGWAVPLSSGVIGDMATVDPVCVPGLVPQTVTVVWTGELTGTGTGGVGANDVFTPRASLWRYNESTNVGTLIAAGSGTAITQSALVAYGPTAYSASVTITIGSAVGFSSQDLMLLIGGNLACGAGLLGGARTFTVSLDVDVSTTKMTFGTQGLYQACLIFAPTILGDGVATQMFNVGLSRDSVGEGTPTATKLATVSKSFDLVGDGVPTMSRLVEATRTFDLVGDGVATRDGLAVTMADDVVGDGVPTMSRLVTAAKSFDLVGDGVVTHVKDVAMSDDVVGEGTITFAKPLNAARTFNVVGDGVVTGRIEIPIDEVPEGGGGTTIIKRPLFLFDD